MSKTCSREAYKRVGSASHHWCPKSQRFQNPTVTKNSRGQNRKSVWERRAGLMWTALNQEWCQGQTAKVLFFTCLTGVRREDGCVMGGGIACVSGPPGTPLPEVGRAYVSYLRKSFGVAWTVMDKGRGIDWKTKMKNSNIVTFFFLLTALQKILFYVQLIV